MKKQVAHLAVLTANLIFGINYSAVLHITHGYIQPFALNIIRVGVSSFLFWIIALARGPRIRIQRKHLGRFLLCALTGVVINQTLFIKGLSMTLSIHASLLILVTPVLIMLVSFWAGQENLTLVKIFGLLAGFAGASILALHHERQAAASNILLGDLLVIINAVSYAFYFVLVKPLMREYPPVFIIRWVFSLGLLALIPIGWEPLKQIHWNSFTTLEFGLLAFVVIGSTFLAYLFNLYGISRLGAGITGSYIYTQPVFAGLIAVFILGESLTAYKILSAILIFTGVYLVSKKKKPAGESLLADK